MQLINFTKIWIENVRAKLRIDNHTTEILSITNGLKQGYGLSPPLFNIVFDMAIREVNIKLEVFSNQGPEIILAYADDIVTVGNSTTKTKEMFIKIEKETKKVGLRL